MWRTEAEVEERMWRTEAITQAESYRGDLGSFFLSLRGTGQPCGDSLDNHAYYSPWPTQKKKKNHSVYCHLVKKKETIYPFCLKLTVKTKRSVLSIYCWLEKNKKKKSCPSCNFFLKKRSFFYLWVRQKVSFCLLLTEKKLLSLPFIIDFKKWSLV